MPGYRHGASPQRLLRGTALVHGRRWAWSVSVISGAITVIAEGSPDGSSLRAFRARIVGHLVPTPIEADPYRVVADDQLQVFSTVAAAVERCLDLQLGRPKPRAADSVTPAFTTAWGEHTLVHWSMAHSGLVTLTGYTDTEGRHVADVEAGRITVDRLRLVALDPSGFPLPVAFTSRAEAGAYLAGTALTHALALTRSLRDEDFVVAA